MVFLLLVEGLTFSSLWNWHISPIIGFSQITIAQGLGISFILSMFKKSDIKNFEDFKKALKKIENRSEEEKQNKFLFDFSNSLIVLGIVWLIHCLEMLGF